MKGIVDVLIRPKEQGIVGRVEPTCSSCLIGFKGHPRRRPST